jgi:cellulose synthase/poly-beta-1,6-N-acetylglucosamine synthase-like glycosyltransferase
VISPVEWAILFYFLLVNSVYAVTLLAAAREMREHKRSIWGEDMYRLVSSEVSPSVSVLAPAYNEEVTVVGSVRSLLNLHYSRLEVVVINDGSKDKTIDVLVKEFDLVAVEPTYPKTIATAEIRGLYRCPHYPNLVVVDKANGGKADALNLGLQIASGDLICAMDADTLVEADALTRMVRPFLYDGGVVCAGGTLRVLNACKVKSGRVSVVRTPRQPVEGFQAVEYVRAFLFGRLGLNRMGGNLIISGAFGLFRRDAVVQAGGYAHDSVGEDMELVVRLRRLGVERKGPSKAVFIPDPVAWTEVPSSMSILGRQRDRWQRGLTDVLWRHRGMCFRKGYGGMGSFVYPYFFLIELLSPLVEATGLLLLIWEVCFGELNPPFMVLFFLCAYGYGALLSLFAMALDEAIFGRYDGVKERVLLMMWALLENCGYRQMLVWARLKGLKKFLTGDTSWGKMERKGFTQETGKPAA